jgi:hypothetical protein
VRIAVTRSGGFAGLVRRGEADTADSPQLADLLSRAALPDSSAETGSAAPDRFVYTIRVGEGDAVTVHEGALDGPLRQLVDTVLAEPTETASGRLPGDDDS